MDNFITESAQNIELLAHNKNFEFIKHDVSNFIKLTDLDFILHVSSQSNRLLENTYSNFESRFIRNS